MRRMPVLAAVLILLLALGAGVWAWDHNKDQNRQREQEAAVVLEVKKQAVKDREIAKQKAQDAVDIAVRRAAERRIARRDTKTFCVGDRGSGPLANADVRKRAEKVCPDVVAAVRAQDQVDGARRDTERKAADARKAAADKPRDYSKPEPPPDGMDVDVWCRARYETVTQGNGPGSYYSDYSDEDISRSELELSLFCDGVDLY